MYTEEDVDVIFTAAGGSGRGVIDAATELSDELGRHLWAIGVDTDSVFDLPEEQRDHLLTSMVKRFDVGIERIVADREAGTLVVPSSLRLGIADGAVGYSTSGDSLSPSTIAAVDEYEAAIAQGSVTVSASPTGLLREAPAAPVAPDAPEARAALDVANAYFTRH